MNYTPEEMEAEFQRRQQMKAMEAEFARRQSMGQNRQMSDVPNIENLPQAPQRSYLDQIANKINPENQNASDFLYRNDNANNSSPFMEQLANSRMIQGTLGYGDALSNQMSKAGSSLISPISKTFGGPQIASPEMKSGQGTSYEVGKFGGEITPYLVPQSLPTRMGTSMLMGGLMDQNDPYAGLATGAAYGAAGEGIAKGAQPAGKTLDWAADKFTRNKYTANLMNSMTENFKKTQEDALSYLNPLLDEYGEKKLGAENVRPMLDTATENYKYLTGSVKKSYDKFMEDMSFKNAQRLQSDLGKKSRKIKGKDSTSINEIEALNEVRESVIESMSKGFEGMSPGASQEFNTFRTKYATGPAQYLNDPTTRKIVMGSRREMTPQKVEKSLSKLTEGASEVPQNHPMRQFQKEITDKLNRSQLYKQGSIVGPIGAHYGFNLPATIQNPQMSKIMEKLGKPYRPISQAAIGSEMSNPEDAFLYEQISSLLDKRNK